MRTTPGGTCRVRCCSIWSPGQNLCMPKNLHTIWTIFVATLALWVYADMDVEAVSGRVGEPLAAGGWTWPPAKAALRDHG